MSILKDALFLALGALWSDLRGTSILMYHSIEERLDHFSSVAPAVFEMQMGYLASHGYRVISLGELASRLQGKSLLNRCVVLTFDDGFRNNYTHAFPVLKRFRFPATIFVVTGRIGQRDKESGLQYLRENELREMEASGLIDIEPHTETHPKLSALSKEEALQEMKKSKEAVERILVKQTRLFAYPYGNYTDETVRVAEECGFKAAVTVREGIVTSREKFLELPRNSVDRSTTFVQFKGKVSSVIGRYEALKRLWR
ncbi:hypothetical protein A3A39_04295 [Candidatus Kaiserbacteria bacterium RIFCSPLOWO2_01_FULL_54_13]|uniref:NodB homology domain-containing protein n=1 Tax=Candidatus Kaiserbacteria bacterium RIFCSPLOWO2_01_FULL_54_13 TaxID=1798512 RepID=A0A1F6F3D3_9BACT|nr:MAG: hypothetical protein A3A39_04295 [Candidatus Kaiserbacteria bacterium RIFCSPLOWO2_01_FULL_54_13]